MKCWLRRHWSKYQCEIFNFVDLCSEMGIVWSITTRKRVSDATAVTFSVKCVNLLKLYPMSGNISRKWFASYFLFIHEHSIIMRSPAVNLIAVATLLLTSDLHRCEQRIFRKNTNYFYAVRISISLAILSETFIQINYSSKSFRNTVYYVVHSPRLCCRLCAVAMHVNCFYAVVMQTFR